MMNDPLAAMLSKVNNAEKTGKGTCTFRPVSKVIKQVLNIMRDRQFVGSYEVIENNKGGIININLIGAINKCQAIKPRFSVTKKEFEKFEKRYLPAKDFGMLIISTSKGLMTHYEAKEKGVGGKLIAYIY